MGSLIEFQGVKYDGLATAYRAAARLGVLGEGVSYDRVRKRIMEEGCDIDKAFTQDVLKRDAVRKTPKSVRDWRTYQLPRREGGVHIDCITKADGSLMFRTPGVGGRILRGATCWKSAREMAQNPDK